MSDAELITVHDSIKPYLNEIAERLWSGHAAIMIGAGFSKNAKANGTSCPGFPGWPQLGDFFYEKIHGRNPDNQKYLNVLKLADEVQAALGRPVLDQLLRSAIPDKDYEPSPLHVKILDLPWTDVFTTNYDTLLERACSYVTSHKYDVVVNKEDLVYSERPRIIKLHGSFPSERPFIITEEDYRRYPKDFAPFVNTVQQALLENTLCLIGFSGDDPNFLQWIGWISDNLGSQNSHKIYLVGIFRLTDAQKKLLEQRNIVLVDLADCPGIEEDHYKALDRFVDYLLSKKADDNRLEWPSGKKLLHPDFRATDKSTILVDILAKWKAERLSYPGWCIIPEDRRSYLWTFTQSWINVISLKDTLPWLMDIEFAYELNWRVEKCLLPMSNNQAELIEKILEKYLPFLVTNSIHSLSEPPEMPECQKLSLEETRRMVLHLSLSMLRFYREDGLIEKWQAEDKKLDGLMQYFSPEENAFLYYERTLFALFALDLPEVRKSLKAWPSNETLPFWEAKRAGLLAEIGQIEEAEKILEESLRIIRSKLNLKPVTTDYSLVSQEAFTMLLLRYVRNAVELKKGNWSGEVRRQFAERWNALKQYKCDPWNELILFESSLERMPIERQEYTEKREFDIGRVTRTHHMGYNDEEAVSAYTFLRFCEEAGLPFRIPRTMLGKKSAEGTLSRISKYSPYWAMATLMRIGDEKIVDHIFNREAIYKLDVAFIDKLIDGYLKVLEKSRSDIQSGDSFHTDNFGILLAQIVPEILSRLCCKCSIIAKNMIFTFLLDIYKSEQRGKYRGIRNLTERLLRSFSSCEQFELIPKLLEFPVLGNFHPLTGNEFLNPFYFIEINKDLTVNWNKPKIKENQITPLLDKANSEIPDVRKWATYTLVRLHDLDLLGKNWTAKLGKVLWSQQDAHGFPAHTSYYKFAFLALPHPKNIAPIALFKHFIRNADFPIQKNSPTNGVPLTGGHVSLCIEIIGASKFLQWTEEEIIAILQRLVEWWDADKVYLERDDKLPPFNSIPEEFRARFSKLINVLVEVVVPALSQNTQNSFKETVHRLLSELREFGLPALRAEAACIHLYPGSNNNISSKTEEALASIDSEVVIDGLRAIVLTLLNYSKETDVTNLLSMLGQMVRWRRRPGLTSALKAVANLINKEPSLFTLEIERLILKGLLDIAGDTDLLTGALDLDFSEKLEIRQAAAGLAYVLFDSYSKQGKTVPDAIRKWEAICSSDDEFAEIRNEWLLFNCLSCVKGTSP